MATLKPEVNTGRLKEGEHTESESFCDNGIGTFAVSSGGHRQLPGVQEVCVRHFLSVGGASLQRVRACVTKINKEIMKLKFTYTF